MEIKSLTLGTTNLPQLLEFYGEVLGFPRIGDGFEVGSSMLTFTAIDSSTAPAHFAINVDPAWIDSAAEWLEHRGVNPILTEGRPFEFKNWQARAVYFSDPVGNIVEFIGRERLRGENHPGMISSISEFGLPVDSIGDAIQRHGLPIFGDPSADFAAVGDDHGLLILVIREREWFPQTGIPARIPAFELDYLSDNQLFTLTGTSAQQ